MGHYTGLKTGWVKERKSWIWRRKLMLLFLRTKPECIACKINQRSVGREHFGAEHALEVLGWVAALANAPVFQICHSDVDVLPGSSADLKLLERGYPELVCSDFAVPDGLGRQIVFNQGSSRLLFYHGEAQSPD